MKIDIHITDCTAKELQSLASWLNDGRRFHVNTYLSKEVKDEEPAGTNSEASANGAGCRWRELPASTKKKVRVDFKFGSTIL